MPEGERVTTGSEPRRFTLYRSRLGDGAWTVALVDPLPHRDREIVEVQEVVEPGHDEQTEARENIERMRELTDKVARLNAQIHGPWQPDPRTVAVVVEALRETYDKPGSAPIAYEMVAQFIEERFGGGTDGH